MKRLLPLTASLLLLALLLPGPSGAQHAGRQGSPAPGAPSPGQGAPGSRSSSHRVRRNLAPRTAPFPEPELDYKVVNCRRSEGLCQEYCNYLETQVGYCPGSGAACCVHLS